MAAKTGTYTLISSNTLGSAAASVTFSSIPATYTDLVLVATSVSGTNQQVRLTLNSDSNTNYSTTELSANGTTASSSRGSTEAKINLAYFGSSAVSSIIAHFNDYSNTATYKTVLGRYNNSASQVAAIVGLWRSTAAITSMTITSQTGNFDIGSTFKLYGIEAGNL